MSSIKDIVREEKITNIKNDTTFKIIAGLLVAIVVLVAFFFRSFWNLPVIGDILYKGYHFVFNIIWTIAQIIRVKIFNIY